MAKIIRYSLDDFNNLIFKGFNYTLPDETLKIISELSLEVGSPTYVKTPVFQKKENPIKSDNNGLKKKKGKNVEISDSDWDTIRTFQATKIIHNVINNNNNITEDITRVSFAIFEIASTNRFYSKMYADLYSDIITEYDVMKDALKNSLDKFSELFNVIEYVDPSVDYDKFCKINKDNEKRKALGAFFINLSNNGIITNSTIINITRNLLSQTYSFISQENKKNEVDEFTENIAIFYKKELYGDSNDINYDLIEGYTIPEIITKIATSKVKDYKSLTNKTIFKFMDMIDM